jgi:hypothetical protein
MYYDKIAIDGVVTNWNLTYPASALPGGWTGATGVQFQIDTTTVTGTQTLDMYIDQVKFSAAPVVAGSITLGNEPLLLTRSNATTFSTF